MIIKKFLFCHLIICNLRLCIWGWLTTPPSVWKKPERSEDTFTFSVFMTLISLVLAQVLQTRAHPVDTVERFLKCLKGKIQTEACSSRAALEMLAWCLYSFHATWAVFCLSNVSVQGSHWFWQYMRIQVDWGISLNLRRLWAMFSAVRLCAQCFLPNISLLFVFCSTFTGSHSWWSAEGKYRTPSVHFFTLFAGLIYCKFYHTSAQNINRVL